MNFIKSNLSIILTACVCLLGGYFNIPETIYNGVYSVQKKIICKKIFSEVNNKEFNKLSGKYSTVYYTNNGESYVNMIMTASDMYYPMIAEEFNWHINENAQIIIYDDKEMFGKILKTDKNQIPMGAYYGGVLNILSPELWVKKNDDYDIKDTFIDEGPMVHELVHLVIDNRLEGKYPLWFTEGMALYYENKYTGFEWRKDLKEKSKSITIAELESKFSLLDEGTSYRKSYDIINNIVVKYGEKTLDNIVQKMSEGSSFNKAYEEVTGELTDNL